MPFSTSRFCPKLLLAITAVHLGLAAPVAAQRIRGQLVEEGSGRAVEGAFIVLIDSAGTELTGVLSDAAGRFVISAPTRGLYRLRADRIGYRSTFSPELALELGQTLEHRMAVPIEAIQLAGITATAEARCVVRPEEGEETARVWEEARKALTATRWTEQQGMFSFQTERYRRTLDSRTLVVQEEQSESGWRSSGPPFETPPADTLVKRGFVQPSSNGQLYYAPSADVLLSDVFLDSHCFGVRSGDDEETDLIGLTFKPLPGKDAVDVEGVLWLDAKTAELSHLEYRYTGLPFDMHTAALFGGSQEFERLPSGAWIIRRWWIRGPIRGTGRGYVSQAIQEEGGAVTQILSRNTRD